MKPIKILLVSATQKELFPFFQNKLSLEKVDEYLTRYSSEKYTIDHLITGVGIAYTSSLVSRALAQNEYHFAINAGIGGAYNRNLALGEVVVVNSDCFPEIGADDDEKFISGFELGFFLPDAPPFFNGALHSNFPEKLILAINLKKVSGNTVSTCSGNEDAIAMLLKRNKADVESMEGAAFYLSSLISGNPCIQIRAISNYVEKRDTQKWNIPLAIQNLNQTMEVLLDLLSDY